MEKEREKIELEKKRNEEEAKERERLMMEESDKKMQIQIEENRKGLEDKNESEIQRLPDVVFRWLGITFNTKWLAKAWMGRIE